MKSTTARIVSLLSHIEMLTATTAFAVMIVVVSANVVIRFITRASLVFTEEIAYLCFGYAIFFGVSVLFRMRALIAVDVLVNALPQSLRRMAGLVAHLVMVCANGYFFYLSANLAATSWVRKTAFLDIPYFWINLAPAASFGLMTIYSVWFLTLLLRRDSLGWAEAKDSI